MKEWRAWHARLNNTTRGPGGFKLPFSLNMKWVSFTFIFVRFYNKQIPVKISRLCMFWKYEDKAGICGAIGELGVVEDYGARSRLVVGTQ